MAQSPYYVEMPPPFPAPEHEQAPFQESRSFIHAPVFTTELPPDTAHPEVTPWVRWMRRMIPRRSVAVFLVLIVVTGISFCPALLSNAKPFDLIILDGVSPDVDGVKILGNIFQFNWQDPSKVSVTWAISGVGNYTLQTAAGYPTENPPPNTAMDIYLGDPSNPVFSYDPAHLATTSWSGDKLPVRSLYTFNMQHTIELGVQYFAPDDKYSFSAFVFAIEKATNKSVPIITFEIGSSGSGDFGSSSEVVPSNSQFTITNSSGQTTVAVKSHTIYADVVRSIPARALTYSMFAINWLLALCSIVTTSVAFNRAGGHSDFGITLLPVTVILTIPAVRNLYVGSPPFGIFLDVVGFFPQMLIVASCTVVVLTGYALKSIHVERACEKDEGKEA